MTFGFELSAASQRDDAVIREQSPSGGLEALVQYANDNFTLQILPNREVELLEVSLIIPHRFERDDRIFANGFQSWTHSREFGVDEAIAPLKKISAPFAKAFGDQAFFKYPNRKGFIHGWAYGYVRHSPANEQTFFIGALNEYTGYTLLQFETPNDRILVQKDCKNLLLESGASYLAFDLLLMRAPLARCVTFYGETMRTLLPMRELPAAGYGLDELVQLLCCH